MCSDERWHTPTEILELCAMPRSLSHDCYLIFCMCSVRYMPPCVCSITGFTSSRSFHIGSDLMVDIDGCPSMYVMFHAFDRLHIIPAMFSDAVPVSATYIAVYIISITTMLSYNQHPDNFTWISIAFRLRRLVRSQVKTDLRIRWLNLLLRLRRLSIRHWSFCSDCRLFLR